MIGLYNYVKRWWRNRYLTEIPSRDHELGECSEVVENGPGYTIKRCDSCRIEMYTLDYRIKEDDSDG